MPLPLPDILANLQALRKQAAPVMPFKPQAPEMREELQMWMETPAEKPKPTPNGVPDWSGNTTGPADTWEPDTAVPTRSERPQLFITGSGSGPEF